MSKYDFALRLKRLVHEESKVNILETKVARTAGKHYQQMTHLKTYVSKQELELSSHRKEIENLKKSNKKLEDNTTKAEDRLCTIIQNVEKMQLEHQQILQDRIKERSVLSLQMACISNIKQSTATYINLSALPHMIQGVTLCENETSSDWKPFCIDPLKHTKQEVQDQIWHESQLDSVHRKTWEELILGDLLQENNNKSVMETDNGNVTIVI